MIAPFQPGPSRHMPIGQVTPSHLKSPGPSPLLILFHRPWFDPARRRFFHVGWSLPHVFMNQQILRAAPRRGLSLCPRDAAWERAISTQHVCMPPSIRAASIGDAVYLERRCEIWGILHSDCIYTHRLSYPPHSTLNLPSVEYPSTRRHKTEIRRVIKNPSKRTCQMQQEPART